MEGVLFQESSGEMLDTSCVADKQLQDKEKALLEKYKPVLQAFLHDRPDLQMIAIYSLQVLCYSLQFPKGKRNLPKTIQNQFRPTNLLMSAAVV